MASEAAERFTVTGDRPDYEKLLDLLGAPAWHRDAACKEAPQSITWFPLNRDFGEAAKAVCGGCLASEACLAFALSDPTLDGIWAGTTAKERRAIRAGRTEVAA